MTALLVLQLLNLVGLLGQGTFLHAQQNISSVLMLAEAFASLRDLASVIDCVMYAEGGVEGMPHTATMAHREKKLQFEAATCMSC